MTLMSQSRPAEQVFSGFTPQTQVHYHSAIIAPPTSLYLIRLLMLGLKVEHQLHYPHLHRWLSYYHYCDSWQLFELPVR